MTQMPLKQSRGLPRLVAAVRARRGCRRASRCRPAPRRSGLLGVSAGTAASAVLIEASEPVAYTVSRPDPLTVLVDLRNVTVADAANQVARGGADRARHARTGRRAVDGESARARAPRARAPVRATGAQPAQHDSRGARAPSTTAARRRVARPRRAPVATAPPATTTSAPCRARRRRTIIEQVRADRTRTATTVTLSGNGPLDPGVVSESEDQPRRLVLDFPNVSSKAPARTDVDGALVKQVRVGVNSRQPLVTRVVMELSSTATYHVERAGADGRDLAVVFEGADVGTSCSRTAHGSATARRRPEPDIPMQQAIANAAALATPPDPMSALTQAPAAARRTPGRCARAGPDQARSSARARRRRPRPSSRRRPGRRRRHRPPAAHATARGAADRRTAAVSGHGGEEIHRRTRSLDFSGADLRDGAALLLQHQRAQHHHRPVGAGDAGRHPADRRAVGPGVRDDPARQQAGLRRGGHDHPDRAAVGARRRGSGQPQADRGQGARRRSARADLLAQLREGGGHARRCW